MLAAASGATLASSSPAWGSAVAAYVQGTYGDANAVVSSGLVFVPYKRPLDPALIQDVATRSPYFKLPPEARQSLLYRAAGTDPAVIVHELAALDDIIPRGYVFTIFPFLEDTSVAWVNKVTSPVLIQPGEYDALPPGFLAEQEALVWASAESLTLQSLAGLGHSFNGHRDADLCWGASTPGFPRRSRNGRAEAAGPCSTGARPWPTNPPSLFKDLKLAHRVHWAWRLVRRGWGWAGR